MTTGWKGRVLGIWLGLFCIGLAILGHMAAEQLRSDEQRATLSRWYDEAAQSWRTFLIRLERHATAQGEARTTPWTVHLRVVDNALAQRDAKAAETAWHEAHRAALRSRHWEAMLDLGDATRRIAEAGGFPSTAQVMARTAYLAALFRAREQGSVAGVLRAAEAFAMLGDREAAEQSARVAQELADQARDGQNRERVRAFKERWGRNLGWSQALPSVFI